MAGLAPPFLHLPYCLGHAGQHIANQVGNGFGVNSPAFVVTSDYERACLTTSFVVRKDRGTAIRFQFPVPAGFVVRVME